MVVNKRSRDDAVLSCLNAAGHVVVLSGSTLFFTFMLLLAFPQNFLQVRDLLLGYTDM